MKKTVKILSIVLCVLMIMLAFSSVAFANPGQVKVQAPQGGEKAYEIGGKVIGLIQIFGDIVAVAMIVIVGVKYMTASPEGKADYKGTMIPYVVGAVLVFAGANIAKIVYETVSNL